MNHGFWKQLKKPFFILAPMADVTDWPFRQIVAQCGRPDVFFTEFVSADGLASEKGREKLLPMLHYTEDERPVVAQIFSARPENIHTTARLVCDLGFDGLDINMGCPDRKVVKQGAGIALSKTPELAKKIVATARDGATGLPVSVKTRLGFDQIDMRWIKTLLELKLSALSIHLRTMRELSSVPAHWDVMTEIAQLRNKISPETLLIGNGDIITHAKALEKVSQCGIEGIMIGRGIFYNPWFFDTNRDQNSVTPEQPLQLLVDHIEKFDQFWGSKKNFDVLKRFFKIYISGWDGAKELRATLMNTKSVREALDVVTKYRMS